MNRSSGRDKLDSWTFLPRARGRAARACARGLRGTRLAYLACAHLITCGSGCGQGLLRALCGHRLWRTAQRARELLIKSKYVLPPGS